MAEITATLRWQGGLHFTGMNQAGLHTSLDGNRTHGASPMDLLLEAVGACAAIDVVIILEKQRMPPVKFEISLTGARHMPEPGYFTEVTANFDLWGEGLGGDKVARAIALSFAKYCSVFHSLRKDLALTAQYRLHASGAAAAGEYHKVVL
ncbi:MAG: OsmC family protein [Blastocatellia bacterium]